MKRQLLLILPAAALFIAGCSTIEPEPPDRFALADVNKDEKLSKEEVTTFQVTTIFDTRDADKDKSMTRAEWNPSNDPGQETIFAARDLNKDGKVTLEEALAHAKKNGTYNQLMKDADTSKDGFVTREEAKAYYAAREGPFP